ncbi:Polysaccharide deacetylase domain-containing protein [Nosema granulosis]|uniref:Polysaccharide deacetylase domain-containing protein n=1 Tax=Nosema granulosis TaxID=83296 RepID=A0A9P6H2C9_9MICR|nr:Polysaccharide deacetylase domain-containing protein [Nosema granulosis]
MLSILWQIINVACQLPRSCTNAGIIAITFDDGPTNYTFTILEIARQNNIKLTFHFTIHQRMTGDLTDIYKLVIEEGHTLGLRVNPTRDYDNMDYNQVEVDINKQVCAINKSSGSKIKFARAPEMDSLYNQDIYTVLYNDNITQTSANFSVVGFPDPLKEFEEMICASNPEFDSFIVQMHDSQEENDQYLQDFINIGLENGYTFVNLEDCLGDYKPENTSGGNKRSKLSSDGVADICILPLLALLFHIL